MAEARENLPLTYQRLKELLRYNKRTGIFTWVSRPSNRVHLGDEAGSVTDDGYRVVRIDRINYKAHRLAFFYVTGEWPGPEVDHRDGNKLNNRWRNLRSGDKTFNMQNLQRARPSNRSGLLGVCKGSANRRYRAKIRALGKNVHLGYFDTPQQAHAAYIKAKRQLHEGNTL